MANNLFALEENEALLLSYPTDITYVSGFRFLVPEEREAFVVITPHQNYLIKALFSPTPPDHSFEVLNTCQPVALSLHLQTIMQQQQLNKLLIDPRSLFLDEYQAITARLQPNGMKIEHVDRTRIWQQRMIKKPKEIAALRTAAQIVVKTLAAVAPKIRSGITEQQLMQLLEDYLRRFGSERPAFPTIVAFGSHTAAPHHQPTAMMLKREMPVLIDIGATYQGYRSDTTRTMWFGRHPSAEFRQLETTVQTAYRAAFDRLKHAPLPHAQELDRAARDIISHAGFGSNFIHTTGHGVGLDIHEPPSINEQNSMTIRPHMVITIEPGIYLPEKIGYRHENTVLIGTDGPEELT